MKVAKLLKPLAVTGLALLCQCVSGGLHISNPPGHLRNAEENPPPRTTVADTAARTPAVPAPTETPPAQVADSLDFSLAFAEQQPPAIKPALPRPGEIPRAAEPASGQPPRYPAFRVSTGLVRIAMRREVKETALYFVDKPMLAVPGKRATLPDKGRIALRVSRGGRGCAITTASLSLDVSLPCTLSTADAPSPVEIDSLSCRGAVILAPDDAGTFALVNYLPVEEYLRSVVPLEIGRGSEEAVEALKAQAVAARTYTYNKLLTTADSTFDLVPTVVDQVYGGAASETPLTDRAIDLTRDVIAVYDDRPIAAYYHSTCGGRTANVADVWEKKGAVPYLVSVDDRDDSGAPFCCGSRLYVWTETWGGQQITGVLRRFATGNTISGFFSGRFENLRVVSRYSCGRIRSLRVSASGGTCELGGDKLRFALRRGAAGNPILPSARFDVVTATMKQLKIKGYGNGHGVGMCQMGAIGRAKQGQSFEKILKTYYRGIELRSVIVQ